MRFLFPQCVAWLGEVWWRVRVHVRRGSIQSAIHSHCRYVSLKPPLYFLVVDVAVLGTLPIRFHHLISRMLMAVPFMLFHACPLCCMDPVDFETM